MPRGSRSKYSRAATRARIRRTRRRSTSRGWILATVAVVVVGVVLIVASRREATAAPEIGDHWHAAIGVRVCTTDTADAEGWLGAPATFEADTGIHTHGDGIIHIHPFSRGGAGTNATVGTFLSSNEAEEWELSEDSFSLWDGQAYANGDECPVVEGRRAAAAPGEVRWSVNGEEQTGNPADYRPEDGDVVAIAFLPEGEEIGTPPSAGTVPENDGSDAGPVGEGTTTTTVTPPAS